MLGLHLGSFIVGFLLGWLFASGVIGGLLRGGMGG